MQGGASIGVIRANRLDWGDYPVDAIEAIGGFIEVIGNILEFLSRIGEIGGKDEGIIKEQDE